MMISKLFVTISLILLSVAVQAQTKSVANLLKSTTERADHLYQNQHYQQAITVYQQALRKEPNNARIKLQLAKSYRKLNNPSQTVWWYSQVINNSELIAPDHLLNYAQALLSVGELKEAEVWYTRYQQLSATDGIATQKLKGIDQMPTFYRDSLMYTVRPLDINSSASDFAPTFYDSGLVFVSARKSSRAIKHVFRWNETPYYARFFTSLSGKSTVRPFPLFGRSSSNSYHQGPVVFFDDDTKAILTRNNPSNQRNQNKESKLGLFLSEKDGNGWTKPVPLPFNNAEHSVGHAAVTPDGKTLYFISDMPGGVGGTDLYVSYLEDEIWGEPKNLGRPINTKGDELFPFIHQNQTLYFASDGHRGLGGLDIYKTVVGSGIVENIGYPINSSYDDFSLILNEEGTRGYYTSNRNGPAADDNLYQLTTHFQSVDILVSDKYTQQDIEGAEVSLILDGAIANTSVSDSTGLARFRLNPQHTYIINVDRQHYEGDAVIVGPDELLTDTERSVVPIALVREEGSIDLTVRLTNSYTDQPLPHTLVSVVNVEKNDTTYRTTDEAGRIRMKVNNHSHYTFSGQVNESSWHHPEISTQSLHPEQENEIQLLVGVQTPTVPLHISLYDAETKEPLERATVRLIEDGEERAELRTSASGESVFKADPSSNYMISLEPLTHYGDVIIVLSEELLRDTIYRVEVPLKSMQGSIDWVAHLYDSISGLPLANSVVHLRRLDSNDSITLLSNEEGRIQLKLEEKAAYRINCSTDDRHWVGNEPIVIEESNVRFVAKSRASEKILLREVTPPSIPTPSVLSQLLTVKVTDKDTGQPLPEAEIILIGDGAIEDMATTDTTGTTQFTINPANNFILDISKLTYQGNALILDTETLLGYSDTYEAAIVLQPEIGPVDLTIRLYDKRTGQPINHTLAHLVNLSSGDTLNIVTDASGKAQTKVDTRSSYQLSGVVAEKNWKFPVIEASALDKAKKNQISVPIEVPVLRIPLRVLVLDAATKQPLPQAAIQLIEDGEQYDAQYTTSNGELELSINPLKNYLISVERSSYYDDVMIVTSDELTPGEEHQIEISLTRGKSMIDLVAHIYDSLSKEPLENTLVRIRHEPTGKELTSLSDENGNIRMKLERGVTYRISGKTENQNWNHDSQIKVVDSDLADLTLRIAVYNPASQEEWFAKASEESKVEKAKLVEGSSSQPPVNLENPHFIMVNSLGLASENQVVWVEVDSSIYRLVKKSNKWYLKNQQSEILAHLSDTDKDLWLNSDAKKTTINSLFFGFDQHRINSTSAKVLTKIADLMKRHPSLRLEATTHTDSRGSEQYNRILSQKRAQAIAVYLSQQGVPEDRIYLSFYGEETPLYECDQEECNESVHRMNRRGELSLDFIYTPQ